MKRLFICLILAFLAIVSFAAEYSRDLYEMLATDAQNRMDHNASAAYRRVIYINEGDKLSRYRWIETLLIAQNYDETIQEATAALKKDDDVFLRRVLAASYYAKGDLKNAIINAKALAKKEQSLDAYLLLGDLYALNKESAKALKAYRSAYAIAPNEVALDKMATILANNLGKPKDAIAYYETHISERGCGEFLCARLASLYAKLNDASGVARTYKRIYKLRPDRVIGEKIIELYLVDKDYKSLSAWLEETRFNDDILLELYRNDKRFDKAAAIASKLYRSSGNIDYLALSAMFEYEAGDGANKELAKRAVDALEKVVAKNRHHIYLNYLGYILIDHDLDVERGVEYVEQALRIEPDNVYYVDSLAWGYFKQGRYKEAYDLIVKVTAKKEDDPTVQEHYNAIKESYEKSLIESSR
ncbi:MAG: hypothetical protein LBO72_08610 [Helicobacteraceae bacterium]|jgi:tetratricopeptide (TPR) repeat protein|nr:hypothetical protein [Helicobacteraceae bacterium]